MWVCPSFLGFFLFNLHPTDSHSLIIQFMKINFVEEEKKKKFHLHIIIIIVVAVVRLRSFETPWTQRISPKLQFDDVKTVNKKRRQDDNNRSAEVFNLTGLRYISRPRA
ncbi:conserved hypothetical protein [Trichinella spiralis]|uniref:hypothetical protein n=1 Tax=Trichinella spiralis TaxID=6334 RepID=UPI0001EFD6A4|nr:conserved hypothetical protein [Trichinella spiralis]